MAIGLPKDASGAIAGIIENRIIAILSDAE